MVHGEHRIPYWIDRRLTGLAGPEFDVALSLFGLLSEPEDSQYGKYRLYLQDRQQSLSSPAQNPISRCSGGMPEVYPEFVLNLEPTKSSTTDWL